MLVLLVCALFCLIFLLMFFFFSHSFEVTFVVYDSSVQAGSSEDMLVCSLVLLL